MVAIGKIEGLYPVSFFSSYTMVGIRLTMSKAYDINMTLQSGTTGPTIPKHGKHA